MKAAAIIFLALAVFCLGGIVILKNLDEHSSTYTLPDKSTFVIMEDGTIIKPTVTFGNHMAFWLFFAGSLISVPLSLILFSLVKASK